MGRPRRARAGRPHHRAQGGRLNRGDIYDAEWPGAGRHPAVIVTRQSAIPYLRNVVVVPVTSTVRGLRTELPLGPVHGLDHECVANCDQVLTVPKDALERFRGRLGPADVVKLDDALRTALELE